MADQSRSGVGVNELPRMDSQVPSLEPMTDAQARDTYALMEALTGPGRDLVWASVGMFADGVRSGRRATILRLLRRKFGTIPDEALARIQAADQETLDRLEDRLLCAATLDDALA